MASVKAFARPKVKEEAIVRAVRATGGAEEATKETNEGGKRGGSSGSSSSQLGKKNGDVPVFTLDDSYVKQDYTHHFNLTVLRNHEGRPVLLPVDVT